MTSRRSVRLSFVAILGTIGGLGLLLQIAVGVATFPVGLQGDEVYYRSVATELALRERHYSPALQAWSQWPPGNAAWLSLFIDESTPASLALIVAAQIALGSLLVVVVGLFARELADERRACIVAALLAINPTLTAFSHYLWAATLLLVLLYSALWLLQVARRTGSWLTLVASGALFGAAGLTREVGLLVGAVGALWYAASAGSSRRSARAAVGAAVLVATMLATMAPWSLRNLRLHERFVPVSTIGWMSMRIGNTLGAPDWWALDRPALSAFHRRYFAEHDELARMDLAQTEAVAIIAAEQPGWLPKKILRNGAQLFSLHDPVLAKIASGHYGAVSPLVARAAIAAVSASSIALVIGAIVGLIGEDRRSRAALLLGITAVVVGLHVVANANGRYRLPLLPIFAFYTALAVTTPLAKLRDAPRWRSIVGAALLSFYVFVALPFESRHTVGTLWQRGVSAPAPAR